MGGVGSGCANGVGGRVDPVATSQSDPRERPAEPTAGAGASGGAADDEPHGFSGGIPALYAMDNMDKISDYDGGDQTVVGGAGGPGGGHDSSNFYGGGNGAGGIVTVYNYT